MLWGISPALDLIADLKKTSEVVGEAVVNILLIGSTDARHILKTMSVLKRHSKNLKVNFFVMDTAEELVIRQILLLTIALEPKRVLGPLEKSRLWMEVYGNTLVRNSTAKYVVQKMCQIRLMVTDREFLKRRMPLIDLRLMRYFDLDCLEEAAKYYQRNKRYLISKLWDLNLRERLDSDYDHRFNVYDWDYNATLSMIPGGQRVCSSEYTLWRNTGIAFTWLETEYAVGNPTLAVGIGSVGDTFYSHGYMGDMESGPFFAFGTDSEEKKMLECRNGTNLRRATDITERNLQRIFHELEHGSPPSDLYGASVDMGLVLMKPGNVDVNKEATLDYEPDRTPEDYSAIPVPNCSVIFLPGNAMEVYPKKAKYKEFFDVVFVAQNFFKFLNSGIMSMAKPNGCLVIETRKFLIGAHKESENFGNEVRSKLQEIGWEEVSKCHFRRDDHAVCRKSKGVPRLREEISESGSEDEKKYSTENEVDSEESGKQNEKYDKQVDLDDEKQDGRKELNDTGSEPIKSTTSEEEDPSSTNRVEGNVSDETNTEVIDTKTDTTGDENSKITNDRLLEKNSPEKTVERVECETIAFVKKDNITTESENLTIERSPNDAQGVKDEVTDPEFEEQLGKLPEDIEIIELSESPESWNEIKDP